VLLTTQYLEEADRLADNIVVVDGGQIIAEGTAIQLKASLGSTVVQIRMPDPPARSAPPHAFSESLPPICLMAVAPWP
jgi:ABC-2 type transport system ATP-binding protein